jgi:DNA polymerase elongation subunit (family B)
MNKLEKLWYKIILNSVYPIIPTNELRNYSKETSNKITEEGRKILIDLNNKLKL